MLDATSPKLAEGFFPQKPVGAYGGRPRVVLAVLESFDQFDGLAEVAGSDGHDHVDGIEVFLTPEASGEIGFGVGGGLKL